MQAEHWVLAEPVQAEQAALQVLQAGGEAAELPNWPAGHEVTQVVPERNWPETHEVQVVLDVEQVLHGLEQAA